jgi:hypothetical protein
VDRCEECGFVYDHLPRDQIGEAIALIAPQYEARLAGTGIPALRQRPAPGSWSPLEYAAHVRDVLIVQRERVMLALRTRDPVFGSMDPERRVVEHRGNDSDPLRVAGDLVRAAGALAALFDGLSDTEWERSGVYNWPVAASRDLAWIGRHTVHEMSHHLLDIARTLQPTPGWVSG